MAVERLASRRWPQLKGAADEAFVRKGAALLVLEGTASGRAAALEARVRQALDEGVRARDVLVVCADPSSASRMGARLGAADVAVVTGRELARDVASRPEARATTGAAGAPGRVRILGAYEADFVVEDLKTLGARPKRLRELLKFLYRGWTELLDEDPEWLFTVEEIDTFEFLADELAYLGAVMEPQLSNLATKALRLDPGLRAAVGRRRLFVLDYQNLSRASQLLCQLVAGEGLTAVANGASCAEVHESYPYLAGVEDFARLNPAARVEKGAGEKDPPHGAPLRFERVWATPQDEVAGVAGAIADEVEAGADPSDIGVMCLHPWWAQRMGQALEARGVPANVWYGPLKLRGDVRDLDRSLALRTVTLLRLIADPRDGAAWRSWFGFGDYLTRSNLFAQMRATRPDDACPADVRRDLEAFGCDPGRDLDPLVRAAVELRGPELLGCLVQALAGADAPVPPALRFLLALGLDADAGQMVAELDRRQFFAGIPERAGVVVSSYESMAGLDFARVYAVGFVNGLFPSGAFFDLTQVSINKQKKLRERDERTARAMAQLGREALCVSRFERAERAFAERCGVKQARIFATDDSGTQASEAEPSIYTDVLLQRERAGSVALAEEGERV